MDGGQDRNYYCPTDLLKTISCPRYHNEKYCWELDTHELLRKLDSNLVESVTVDLTTTSLIIQDFAKLYALRVNSLEKDTNDFRIRLSKFSRIEEDPNESEQNTNNNPEQENPAPVEKEKPQKLPKPVEKPPAVDPITSTPVEVIPEKPAPKKPLRLVDINRYLEEVFIELKKTLHNFDPESCSTLISTEIKNKIRLKCCDIFLKYINDDSISSLLEAMTMFLNEQAPDFLTKPNERKVFTTTKMNLLIDVRNHVFIPNLSVQYDMLQIHNYVKEYLLEEITRLACHEDCLPHQGLENSLQNGTHNETANNGTIDSGIQESSVLTTEENAQNGTTDADMLSTNQISEGSETFPGNSTTQDSAIDIGTQESSVVTTQDSAIETSTQDNSITETQDSGIANGTQDSSIVAAQDSGMETQDTGTKDVSPDASLLDQEKTNDNVTLEDVEVFENSAEDDEFLLMNFKAISECQETAASMTVNKVQLLNIFGIPKRLLRKKSYFQLPDDILEWARVHKNLNFTPKKSKKDGCKMKKKLKEILKNFVDKNQESTNKIHLEKLQLKCYVPLVSISSRNDKETLSSTIENTIEHSEETIKSPNETQNINEATKPVEGGLTIATAQEKSGTSLHELFENNLLSSASCFDDDFSINEDVDTDSYKTLTHYSNVESGIFTDMTRSSTRENTPSCNATRNNSFFSEYLDDITNMTGTTAITQQDDRTMFNRFDMATQQLQEVPEGNILNQIAEKMQEYKNKERQLLEMYQRVDKWHQSIRERLLRAKRRENWSVIDYENKILKKVPEKPDTIHFALIVARKPHEEICRLFLATLILANEENIIITKTREQHWVMNNFTLSKPSKILRNYERMNLEMKKMSSTVQEKIMPANSSSDFSNEIPRTFQEPDAQSNKSPFLHRLYGSEQSDDEDAINTDVENFIQNIDNLCELDKDEFEPEDRDNIDYDRPVPQLIRRRGRKPKVQEKKSDKRVYVIDNKAYDSPDLDDYVTRIVRNVDAFEERNRNEKVIVNSDLPNIIVMSPKTKLSISKRNEMSKSRRRVYSSSSDDEDDQPLSGLYTPRRPPTKRKLPERNTSDLCLKPSKIFEVESNKKCKISKPELNPVRTFTSKLINRQIPEKNTTDSFLKRFNILDGDEAQSNGYAVIGPDKIQNRATPLKKCEKNTSDLYLNQLNILDESRHKRRGFCEVQNGATPSKKHKLSNDFAIAETSDLQNGVKSSKKPRLSNDHEAAGSSGLQHTHRINSNFISDDDYSSSDSEYSKWSRRRSKQFLPTSTPFNKKSKQCMSADTKGDIFNMSRIN